MLFYEPALSLQPIHNESTSSLLKARPTVQGKFLYRGDQKLWIRGVTYGTFRPNADGDLFPDPAMVERDFVQIASQGFNTIRTYTLPRRWLLDLAARHGLSVMVGLWWDQFVTFLDDKQLTYSIEQRVRESIQHCAAHPAVLAYSLANEIPAQIVRWYGRRKIERFLYKLYRIVKSEDPQGLVTYVNYPTTEYLNLSFLDFMCFNVYLEKQENLKAYLARLQNISGERPLVLAEIGLDSLRHGQDIQADVLDWQIRTVGSAGGAGAFAFAWTDEWYCGGQEIEDWDFGLTDRTRQPKPALAAVRQAFQEFPISRDRYVPRVSVVVCSYNGGRTIRDCLEALTKLEYPNYEVIVVNDGSTDDTVTIAKQFPFRLVSTPNRGLSNARNTGLRLATGDLVAYTDDDAYPDPHWLTYLADMFQRTSHAGIGGPNLPPPNDGWIAECVSNAPGGPIHVLLDDETAEHIPGCNMAFRKSHLEAIGGFDSQFRAAGDDVDICWRLQDRGWTLGFHPSAVVWHHRRNSVQTYWKQQRGYGRAEALLERKWPEKYNAAGHLSWNGRLYGRGAGSLLSLSPSRIYQGVWGSAPFQLMYQSSPSTLLSLLSMPEWNFALVALTFFSVLGLFWSPLLLGLPVVAFFTVGACILACRNAHKGIFKIPQSRISRARSKLVTAGLHLIQPIARLAGRLSEGLTPWRIGPSDKLVAPWPRTVSRWVEQWVPPSERLEVLEKTLQSKRATVHRGGPYDRWDLHVKTGILGGTRVRMAIEEHGAGKQFIRCRIWPKCSLIAQVVAVIISLLSAWAFFDQAWIAGGALATVLTLMVMRMQQEYSSATLGIQDALAAAVDIPVLEQTIELEGESIFPGPVPAID